MGTRLAFHHVKLDDGPGQGGQCQAQFGASRLHTFQSRQANAALLVLAVDGEPVPTLGNLQDLGAEHLPGVEAAQGNLHVGGFFQPADLFSEALNQAWQEANPLIPVGASDAEACGPDGCSI